VVALLALAWLIVAYRQAPTIVLWVAPAWMSAALLPVVLLAVVLVVAGLTTPNPVIVSAERLFERANIVQGVLRVTRNAFFWGTGLFAVAHVILTGHVSGVLAFGSVAVLGLAGARILDAKKARRHGEAWGAFARETSNVPFLAIARPPALRMARDWAVAPRTWNRFISRCLTIALSSADQKLTEIRPSQARSASMIAKYAVVIRRSMASAGGSPAAMARRTAAKGTSILECPLRAISEHRNNYGCLGSDAAVRDKVTPISANSPLLCINLY
jgi:uncharacterized membrane protein